MDQNIPATTSWDTVSLSPYRLDVYRGSTGDAACGVPDPVTSDDVATSFPPNLQVISDPSQPDPSLLALLQTPPPPDVLMQTRPGELDPAALTLSDEQLTSEEVELAAKYPLLFTNAYGANANTARMRHLQFLWGYKDDTQ